jgi:sugar lactone lactonase YvrE
MQGAARLRPYVNMNAEVLSGALNRLFVFFARLAMATAVACLFSHAAEEPVTAQAMTLAREATRAADAKDPRTYLARMEQAVALRPDYPRMLVNLAAAQVANERFDDAIATLNRLAALGVNSPVDKSEDFAPLRGRKEFDDVVKKLADNLQPHGDGKIAFTLRGVTGLIEGIAWREKTDEFYFGDVNGRAVWVWSHNKESKNPGEGTLRRLTPEGDALFGVFGLAIDEDHGTLWAATSAVPAMHGFAADMDGTAALAEIDLNSGEVRRTIPVVRAKGDQQSHVLGDLTLGPDGTIYLPDSGAPVVWQLPPGGKALEPFAESPEFMSAQGAVVLPGGTALVVSDYPSGLLRVDVRTRAVHRLVPPPDAALGGLDGLVLAPNGDILAIQNGTRPNRVLRIALEGDAQGIASVTVLESGHLQMAEPSLACLGEGGNLFFIGNAGWSRFENTDAAPTEPRSIPIYRTKIGGAEAKKQ